LNIARRSCKPLSTGFPFVFLSLDIAEY
jgi:hypothetical protein